jgi:hypothetical protein
MSLKFLEIESLGQQGTVLQVFSDTHLICVYTYIHTNTCTHKYTDTQIVIHSTHTHTHIQTVLPA